MQNVSTTLIMDLFLHFWNLSEDLEEAAPQRYGSWQLDISQNRSNSSRACRKPLMLTLQAAQENRQLLPEFNVPFSNSLKACKH